MRSFLRLRGRCGGSQRLQLVRISRRQVHQYRPIRLRLGFGRRYFRRRLRRLSGFWLGLVVAVTEQALQKARRRFIQLIDNSHVPTGRLYGQYGMALIAVLAVISIESEAVLRYTDRTAQALHQTSRYAQGVLAAPRADEQPTPPEDDR